MLTSKDDKRVSSGEVARCEVTVRYRVLLLSQSLDDLGTTRDECLGRTRWSSPLDSTTYLYYFTSGCTPITTQSHVLPEHSMITWPCHVIWLSDLPRYLYLDSIVQLDVRDQLCECMGNSFLSGALITLIFKVCLCSQEYSRREIHYKSDMGCLGKRLWGIYSGSHSHYSATQARCSSLQLDISGTSLGGQTRLSS